MSKYYYLDENNNKRYYNGNVVFNYNTNSYWGILEKMEPTEHKISLTYHDKTDAEIGWESYFTYVDENCNISKYTGNLLNIRKNPDGTYFTTKVNRIEIPVIKHDKIEGKEGYFSYIDENGEEQIYTGKYFFDKQKSTYYFYK